MVASTFIFGIYQVQPSCSIFKLSNSDWSFPNCTIMIFKGSDNSLQEIFVRGPLNFLSLLFPVLIECVVLLFFESCFWYSLSFFVPFWIQVCKHLIIPGIWMKVHPAKKITIQFIYGSSSRAPMQNVVNRISKSIMIDYLGKAILILISFLLDENMSHL